MEGDSSFAIWWIRKDLRLNRNPTLARAAMYGRVIPVFVIDGKSMEFRNDHFRKFLLSALSSLDNELREIGSGLNVFAGFDADEIPRLAQKFQCPVFTQNDFTPEIRGTFEKLKRRVELVLVDGRTAMHPSKVLNNDGNPYKVFSSYRNKWMSTYRSKAVELDLSTISFSDTNIVHSTYDISQSANHKISEMSAQELFTKFKSESGALWNYGQNRSRVDIRSTSGLSPYINLGVIAPIFLTDETFVLLNDDDLDQVSKESVIAWQTELIWREFFISALFHFPETATQSFNELYARVEWNESEEAFERWKHGQTGYPIVDAAMRQLMQEGWIHNRLRMIVASFLVKDLLIDWRKGANWFGQTLIDIDDAANIGGWQWTAGTGLDAAPYFRVFNPVLQAEKFDPFGEYVRKWVPELSSFDDKHVHKPWVKVGRRNRPDFAGSYPHPMIDHKDARQMAIEAFKKSRTQVVNEFSHLSSCNQP